MGAKPIAGPRTIYIFFFFFFFFLSGERRPGLGPRGSVAQWTQWTSFFRYFLIFYLFFISCTRKHLLQAVSGFFLIKIDTGGYLVFDPPPPPTFSPPFFFSFYLFFFFSFLVVTLVSVFSFVGDVVSFKPQK